MKTLQSFLIAALFAIFSVNSVSAMSNPRRAEYDPIRPQAQARVRTARLQARRQAYDRTWFAWLWRGRDTNSFDLVKSVLSLSLAIIPCAAGVLFSSIFYPSSLVSSLKLPVTIGLFGVFALQATTILIKCSH